MTTEETARPGTLEPVQDASLMWRYIAPPHHTLEMVLQPHYWRHNTRECERTRFPGRNAWNRIEIIAGDGSWEAELRVVSVAGDVVKTRVIRSWRDPGAKSETPAPEGYIVEFLDNHGWRTMDRTGKVLAEKLAMRDQALAVATEHHKAVKGGK